MAVKYMIDKNNLCSRVCVAIQHNSFFTKTIDE